MGVAFSRRPQSRRRACTPSSGSKPPFTARRDRHRRVHRGCRYHLCAPCTSTSTPARLPRSSPSEAGSLISVIDLMAAVPSIIYGLWGVLVLQPFVGPISVALGPPEFIPIFRVPKGTIVFTRSYFIAGVLVGIMIMPIVTSITKENSLLDAGRRKRGRHGTGCHPGEGDPERRAPFQVRRRHRRDHARVGRTLGEAVAVTIILSLHIRGAPTRYPSGDSIAALIASRFGSGGPPGHSALLACGFMLFVFTLMVNLGRFGHRQRRGAR